MRILELENRGAGNFTEGSNPSLSAIYAQISAKNANKLLLTPESPSQVTLDFSGTLTVRTGQRWLGVGRQARSRRAAPPHF
jgi:hypothetical protein